MKLSYKLYFHFKEENSIELHIWSVQTTSSKLVRNERVLNVLLSIHSIMPSSKH